MIILLEYNSVIPQVSDVVLGEIDSEFSDYLKRFVQEYIAFVPLFPDVDVLAISAVVHVLACHLLLCS